MRGDSKEKMPRKSKARLTLGEAEIRHVLALASAGTPTSHLCARYGFSLAEFFRWKARFGEPGPHEEADELAALRRENALLRSLVKNLLNSNRSAARSQRARALGRSPGPTIASSLDSSIDVGSDGETQD